ncbi:MAG TPA: hypothetical protein VMF30_04505, partial [Pirellulales bacterium]|nr:hypothetical protein [Pirellulales bacterium]
MLSAALQAAGETGTARLSPSNVALMSALGDVLVNSGKYQSAIGWLERAREASEQTADPSRQSLADQAAIALLLSNAYGRLGQIDRAIAALQTTLSHYEKANVVDPVVQLELIAGLLSFDRTFRPTATNAALAEKVGRLADQLAASHQRELIGVDDYARGLTALADCRLHLAEADAATLTTEKLIHLRTGGRKTLEEMAARRRLAEIYRGQVDYESEIKTLRAALDALGRQQQGDPAAHDFQVRLRYERAEIERLLVAALLHGEHQEEALSQLDRAEEDFVAALALARLMPTGGTAGVSQGRLLERIADVARQRLEMGRLDAQRLDRAITAHAELLDDYRKTLLADDPRIGSLELILGSLHLQAGDAVRAAPPLQAALAYWRKREPPDRYRLAQALHLVGEASLASIPAPRADQIEHYLAESHRLCLKHFPQDPLRWRVQLALGRLAVGMGRYGQALDWLHELSADNPSIPNEVCSAALLQLGLLYKQLLKFDEADRLCRAGLALRRQAIGEHDAGLSPFYLALGSLQVARRDVDALDGYVARNVALGVAQSHNAPWRWELAHLQAMAHYLRNEGEQSAAERQAARAAWRQLLSDEPDLPTALRARSLHYLSRLDYLDWSSELDAWNREFAAHGARDSRDLAQLAEQLERYRKDQARFLADYAAYDPKVAGDRSPADHEKQFRDLLARRQALEKTRIELRSAHAAALEGEKQRVQAESGVQKTWLAKLTEGG